MSYAGGILCELEEFLQPSEGAAWRSVGAVVFSGVFLVVLELLFRLEWTCPRSAYFLGCAW